MKRKKAYVVLALAALLMTGCGIKSNTQESAVMESAMEDVYKASETEAGDIGYDSVENDYEASADMTEEKEDSGEQTVQSVAENRKLIQTIQLDLETLEYEKTIAFLEDSVSACGGYIESSNLEGNSIYSTYAERSGNFTVRIPKDKTQEFIQGMDENTNVRRKSESTEDITLQYVDTQSHKEALKVEQERLMAILEKAETVEDIISLESRLSQVRYELGNYESTLRTYDNLVDYTTINIEVNEVAEITEPPKQTSLERIVSGFKRSVKNIGHGLKELFIAIIINLPYLFIWAVVIGAAVLALRRIRRKRKQKQNSDNPDKK